MQYPQQRLAECRCVLTVRRDAQQLYQQQPELVLGTTSTSQDHEVDVRDFIIAKISQMWGESNDTALQVAGASLEAASQAKIGLR